MKQKIFKNLVVSVLVMGMLFTTPVTADAATVTKSTKISTMSEYSYSSGISTSGAIYVQLDEPGDYITNIKSKNSGLTAKLTYAHSYYAIDSSPDDKDYYAVIGLLAKKKVSTSVSFDIYGEDNKKKETKTVKVTAVNTSSQLPVKSITFGGKPLTYSKLYTSKKGKVKVTMNKNYKLVKLEAGTYTAPKKFDSNYIDLYENELAYKTIKNNSKVTLGTRGYYYSYFNQSYGGKRNYTLSTRIVAPTYLRITYENKKTKATGTVTYSIKRLAK